ncbi:MAG: AMIN domain-containing protein [bacterium]|nr:AMIN domain-containing protein [bacterium]
MKKDKYRSKNMRVIFIVLLLEFMLINPTLAQDGTRILISTSGPTKFNSYWLDSPPRLVIEFQSKNVMSKIDSEVIVNQGIIKRNTSNYFKGGEKRPLKSLIFELTQKAPYKIQQENDSIVIDIQTPFEGAAFSLDNKGVVTVSEDSNEKLKAMDLAFIQAAEKQMVLEPAEVKVVEETSEELNKVKDETVLPKTKINPTKEKKSMMGMIFQILGLILAAGLGFLLWHRYRLILDKNIATRETAELKLELEEKNKFIEQEKVIRKTIESTSLAKEKEYKQVKNSLESLKEVLINKGLAKKLSSSNGEEELWIPGRSPERRQFSRLDLSRDYSRTIILRIESLDKSKSTKSFANNINLGGLCFEARKDFEEKETITLRLFFF